MIEDLRFAEPAWLWLLAVPAGLLVLWLRMLLVRRRDVRRLRTSRQVPLRERFGAFGDALAWLGVIAAVACLIVALARPQTVASLVRRGGLDVVVLLDGSASMHVTDMNGSRWQRSVRFLRSLGDALSWTDDRIALTLFAHIAAPQVRLTRDPNTLFFFLDHLGDAPPFRLEDDTSWDTNIELGIDWGLRIIDKDEELNGASANTKVFVLLSDGQAWSGTVAQSLAAAREREIPVFVVGVGTQLGGLIPDPNALPGAAALVSRLDRASLRTIASAGGAEYFELEQRSDREIAARIVDGARRRAVAPPVEAQLEEMYWPALLAAGGLLVAATLFLRDRADLWVQAAGVGAILITAFSLFG
ncbi:MAG: vWA domain-containing protein [Vicinamibacterales bacterium]